MYSFILFLTLYICSIYSLFAKNTDSDRNVTQIHIAQGKTPTSMIISWSTPYREGEYAPDSEVRYSMVMSIYNNSAYGDSTSYSFTGYDYPELYKSNYFHHVTVSNLEPETTYYYIMGDFNKNEISESYQFTTLSAVGSLPSSDKPMVIGILGDLGQTNDSISTYNHLVANRDIGLIMHVGDLGYADCNQSKWDSYAIMVEGLASKTPWMVGAGNHEVEISNDGYYFQAFEARYRMPQVYPPIYGDVTITPSQHDGHDSCTPSIFQMNYDFGNAYYSYDSGLVHGITLNCYSTSNETSLQYSWLENDLLGLDRDLSPWVVVSIHCPLYSSNEAHYEENQSVQMRNSMESLFYKYNVNLIITGHVHAYERSYPVYKQDVVNDGTIYIVIGDGGNNEGHASSYKTKPSWSAMRDGTQYGHGTISIYNQTHMDWDWHRNIDHEPIITDSITICNTAMGYNADCK